MYKSILAAMTLATSAATKNLKMASLSDVHLFTDYDPTTDGSDFCWGDGPKADQVAYFGRWNCDLPEVTIRALLQKMQDMQPNLDVLFLPGDLVAHAVSYDYDIDFSTASYTKQLQILEDVANLMIEYFPNSVLIPTLGNNDTKWHYQPPFDDAEGTGGPDFLTQYWTWFFENNPANSQLADLASIKETFMIGGYFAVQISQHLTVISGDTLYFDNENMNEDRPYRVGQLEWMENLFATADPDMKFILTDHIYETGAFAGPTTKENYGYSANWYEDSTLREYYRMMWNYKDKIVFKITGHDHLTDLRVHSSKYLFSEDSGCNVELPYDETPFLGKLLTPSVTVQQWQNPGFATFEWNAYGKQLLFPQFTFLQLEPTFGQPADFTDFEWYTADIGDLFGLYELNSQTIFDFSEQMMSNYTMAKEWLTVRRGYETYGDLSLEGDVDVWGFAPEGTTKETIFTSLDTGLLPVFCNMRYGMWISEATTCYENNGQMPVCT